MSTTLPPERLHLQAIRQLEDLVQDLLLMLPDAEFVCFQIGWKPPLDDPPLLAGLITGRDPAKPPVTPQQLIQALAVCTRFQQTLLNQYARSLEVLDETAQAVARQIVAQQEQLDVRNQTPATGPATSPADHGAGSAGDFPGEHRAG